MRQPLATWPGLPLRSREIYVPEDAQGDLWGPREHGILHVDARWPGQPRPEIAASISWRRTTVGELCERLPPGATTTVRCTGLDDQPRALDLTSRLGDLSVVRLAPDHPFAALARHQGAPNAYELTRQRGATHEALLLGVARSEAERSTRDFADDCDLMRLHRPAALWSHDDLPRRLRKLLETA